MRMGEPTHMLPHFLHHVTVAIEAVFDPLVEVWVGPLVLILVSSQDRYEVRGPCFVHYLAFSGAFFLLSVGLF